MSKLLKNISAIDWILSIGTILVGIYMQSSMLIAGGTLGLGIAWYNPAARLKAHLGKKFLRKTAARSDASSVAKDDQFYAEPALQAPAEPEAPPAVPDFSRGLTAGALYLHSSPHNQISVTYLQLAQGHRQDGWA